MDSHRFDTFARALSTCRSRRGALGLLSGLLAPPLLDHDPASAKKKKKKKKVTLCHNGQTIKVAKKKRKVALGLGAMPGACPPPPSSPPPGSSPPPAPSCVTTGCPFFEVCQAGTCVNCLSQSCTNNSQCCTNLCAVEAGQCACVFGNAAPDVRGCTSNAQCCNGTCDPETKRCACDPPGSPCPFGDSSACCSGSCVNMVCQ